MTLAQCLDKHGVLPNEIGYSVLKDVVLALSYLHQHSPPIIHRDLSANNVLLTPGMTAKISDLGVAKILDLNPSQTRTMTQTPGTQCYMPPEALELKPIYDTKVDVFSYGVLMVHLFSGQWPFPTNPVKVDPDDTVISITEADRRQEYLDAIGRDHPLMNLMLGCLNNSPTCRPEAVEILTQVSRVAAQFPSSSENKVELLQQLTSLRAETNKQLQSLDTEIKSMKREMERLQQANRADRERLQQANRADRERLQQANRADRERLQQAHEAEIKSLLESTSTELQQTLQAKDSIIVGLQEQLRCAQVSHRENSFG